MCLLATLSAIYALCTPSLSLYAMQSSDTSVQTPDCLIGLLACPLHASCIQTGTCFSPFSQSGLVLLLLNFPLSAFNKAPVHISGVACLLWSFLSPSCIIANLPLLEQLSFCEGLDVINSAGALQIACIICHWELFFEILYPPVDLLYVVRLFYHTMVCSPYCTSQNSLQGEFSVPYLKNCSILASPGYDNYCLSWSSNIVKNGPNLSKMLV